MQNSTVFLSIKNGGKGIPYGGADEDRPDGSRNHGFKPLKLNPADIAAIPEAQGMPGLGECAYCAECSGFPVFHGGVREGVRQE